MANTGYIIRTYKDFNPYSPTFNTTKTERIMDLSKCPMEQVYNTEIVYDIDVRTSGAMSAYQYYFVAGMLKDEDYGSFFQNVSIDVDWGDGNQENFDVQVNSPSAPKNITPRHSYDREKYEYTVGIYTNDRIYNIYQNTDDKRIVKIKRIISDTLQDISNMSLHSDEIFKGFDETFVFNCPNIESMNGAFKTNINNSESQYEPIPLPSFDFNTFKNNNIDFSEIFANEINGGVVYTGNINEILGNIDFSKLGNVSSMFANQPGLTGEALPIIAQLSHLTSDKYADCFKGCTGLSDYSQIPSDWK